MEKDQLKKKIQDLKEKIQWGDITQNDVISELDDITNEVDEIECDPLESYEE